MDYIFFIQKKTTNFEISPSSVNRFWHAVAQNDGKNMLFHVVMFLWSFPRQHFEIFSKTIIFNVNNSILQLDRYLVITSCSVNRFC